MKRKILDLVAGISQPHWEPSAGWPVRKLSHSEGQGVLCLCGRSGPFSPSRGEGSHKALRFRTCAGAGASQETDCSHKFLQAEVCLPRCIHASWWLFWKTPETSELGLFWLLCSPGGKRSCNQSETVPGWLNNTSSHPLKGSQLAGRQKDTGPSWGWCALAPVPDMDTVPFLASLLAAHPARSRLSARVTLLYTDFVASVCSHISSPNGGRGDLAQLQTLN